MLNSRNWSVKIGLEIHAQLKVNSKIFSNSVALTNLSPNAAVSFFDAGYPGTLPVLNRAFVTQAAKAAIALKCNIHSRSSWERKHYFYLDMPLGYQITQHTSPIATEGVLHFKYNNRVKGEPNNQGKVAVGRVGIERVQMEQDSGKSIHDLHPELSLVDLNRAGTGLIEIVFKPEIETAEQAAGVLRTTQEILRHIGVCDGNLESGSMRCDVNVSVHQGSPGAGSSTSTGSKRVEVKNLNSLQRVRDAVEFESNRQIQLIESGGTVVQETRGFDPAKGVTFSMREKEADVDYRYLPDPDLPNVLLSATELAEIASAMPEVPIQTLIRLQEQYGLTEAASDTLIQKQGVAYFEDSWKAFSTLAAKYAPQGSHLSTRPPEEGSSSGRGKGSSSKATKDKSFPVSSPTILFQWMTGDLQSHLNAHHLSYSTSSLSPAQFTGVLLMFHDGRLSGPLTKNMLAAFFDPKYFGRPDVTAEDIATAESMLRVTDPARIEEFCLLSTQNPKHQVEWQNFCVGQGRMGNFFLGDIMKLSKGTADPQVVLQVLEKLRLRNNPQK